jgi:hypothetical protein
MIQNGDYVLVHMATNTAFGCCNFYATVVYMPTQSGEPYILIGEFVASLNKEIVLNPSSSEFVGMSKGLSHISHSEG